MARLTLRIPESLHERVRSEADREGVSVNAALVVAVAEWVAARRASEWLRGERNAAAVVAARRILDAAGSHTEAPGDEEQVAQWAAEVVRGVRATRDHRQP